MRYLGILALSFALSSPAAARKRPRHHATHRRAAPIANEAPPPPPAAAPSNRTPQATQATQVNQPMPASAIAQENDDEVPGRHKK